MVIKIIMLYSQCPLSLLDRIFMAKIMILHLQAGATIAQSYEDIKNMQSNHAGISCMLG